MKLGSSDKDDVYSGFAVDDDRESSYQFAAEGHGGDGFS